MSRTDFLSGVKLRPVTLPENAPVEPVGLALGQGDSALEVLVSQARTRPQLPRLRTTWKDRHGRRPAPLLLVVLHDGKATVCGPTGDDPPVYPDADPGQVERICREALEQPNRHAAIRALGDTLKALDAERSPLPGVRNEGFLASHELARGAPLLDSWDEANERARPLLNRRGESLLTSLGFTIEQADQVTSILRLGQDGRKGAVAVLLRQGEAADINTDRFSGLSPVSYAMTVAERENAPYVITVEDRKIRLYPVDQGVGVGQRGRTETFIEVHAGLLPEDKAAYLWLLFSAEALADGGSLARLLDDSRKFAGSLAERLRERIYDNVVPLLAEGLADARGVDEPSAQDLAQTYEMAMTVLFRLLFIAYAEDKNLLPYESNGLYQRRSLKQKAQELAAMRREGKEFDESDSYWNEVSRLFRAVEEGKPEWEVPEYDGGLFSRDPGVSPVGALLADISLPNTIFGPALQDLVTIQTDEGWGPVDFRSLGVREFGTIYEGLLESELSIAETDLVVDRNGLYRPFVAGEDDGEPVVTQGRVYLHNRSGARKSTGSYFTKSFAVEHLLDKALEPALTDHLHRLDDLDENEASERFFDFRVADIAMGSGHFLVAAIDRIERRFTRYLARRGLTGVKNELASLRAAAEKALGALADQTEIEDTQLLRRQIARRCIYGVDLNPVAVNLARVSIWIHTFVPGLPLSLLDRTLVCGNSLVGVGQIEELREIAAPEGANLYTLDLEQLVGEAMEPLDRLAHLNDATPADLDRARAALTEIRSAVEQARAFCDVATASRMRQEALPVELGKWEEARERINDSKAHKAAREELKDLKPLHFPIAFPEVFLRDRPGFDVILGNPPWEEAMCDVNEFWGRFMPGFRGLPQRQQEAQLPRFRTQRPDLEQLYESERARVELLRTALVRGPYPGMHTGHPDLYKAFCWRFWHLACANGGWIGVVLPRSALNAKGSTEFREAMLDNVNPADITVLLNTGGWVFDDAEPRYTIGLVALHRADDGGEVRLLGPFASRERFDVGVDQAPAIFTADQVRSWTGTSSLPLLPTEGSLDVFARLREHPRLDVDESGHWRARPVQGDINATWGKPLMDLVSRDRPRGYWPVFKGESFDLFTPDTGAYYAWADPNIMLPELQGKRERSGRNRRSAYSEFDLAWLKDPATLPCFAPRIAFRDVTNRTNQRTLITALVPPNVVITNKAPFFLWPRGDQADEAYLLGVLSSLPLDWYGRRFVEASLNFYIINPFPVPRPEGDDPRRLRLIELAARLSAVQERFADWAATVSDSIGQPIEVGPLEDEERVGMLCELDAMAAHLYGLEERHLRHIFETFHEGWEPGATAGHWTLGAYDERLDRTLEHYRAWGWSGSGGERGRRRTAGR